MRFTNRKHKQLILYRHTHTHTTFLITIFRATNCFFVAHTSIWGYEKKVVALDWPLRATKKLVVALDWSMGDKKKIVALDEGMGDEILLSPILQSRATKKIRRPYLHLRLRFFFCRLRDGILICLLYTSPSPRD